MIRVDLANIITIALCGILGYGVLVAGKKAYDLAKGAPAS